MFQKVRFGASFLLLTLAIATAALWAHSYAARSCVSLRGKPYRVAVESWQGVLDFTERNLDIHSPVKPLSWNAAVTGAAEHREDREKAAGWGPLNEPKPFTFIVRRHLNTTRDGRVDYGRTVTLPHWCFVLAAATLAVAIRPPPRFRYGLRETLAVTTVIAIVLAGFAALLRVTSG